MTGATVLTVNADVSQKSRAPSNFGRQRGLGGAAWFRRNCGLADQYNETLARVDPVAGLAAETIRRYDENAVGCGAPAGNAQQPGADGFWERLRHPHVETKLDGGRNLVDVLPAGSGGAHEHLLDLRGIKENRVGDLDPLGHGVALHR
jgi:hypothetical protein